MAIPGKLDMRMMRLSSQGAMWGFNSGRHLGWVLPIDTKKSHLKRIHRLDWKVYKLVGLSVPI